MGDRRQRLKEHSAGRGTYQNVPASTVPWLADPVGRYSLVSLGGPRHAVGLVDLHKSRQKNGSQQTGHVRPAIL